MSTIWLRAEQPIWAFCGIFDPNVGTNKVLLREIAQLVMAEIPLKMRVIRHAIVQRDGETLCAKAHSFRGALSILIQPQSLDTLYKLELMGRDNDLEGALQLYDDLKLLTNSLLANITLRSFVL